MGKPKECVVCGTVFSGRGKTCAECQRECVLCGLQIEGSGLCKKHYQQMYKSRLPAREFIAFWRSNQSQPFKHPCVLCGKPNSSTHIDRICAQCGNSCALCNRAHSCGGLCSTHYSQKTRSGLTVKDFVSRVKQGHDPIAKDAVCQECGIVFKSRFGWSVCSARCQESHYKRLWQKSMDTRRERRSQGKLSRRKALGRRRCQNEKCSKNISTMRPDALYCSVICRNRQYNKTTVMVGDIIECRGLCGKQIALRSGSHAFCEDCALRRKLEQSREGHLRRVSHRKRERAQLKFVSLMRRT